MQYIKLIKRRYIDTTEIFKHTEMLVNKAKLLNYNYSTQSLNYLNKYLNLDLSSDTMIAGEKFYSERFIFQCFGNKVEQYCICVSKKGYVILKINKNKFKLRKIAYSGERDIKFHINDGHLYLAVFVTYEERTISTNIVNVSFGDSLQMSDKRTSLYNRFCY